MQEVGTGGEGGNRAELRGRRRLFFSVARPEFADCGAFLCVDRFDQITVKGETGKHVAFRPFISGSREAGPFPAATSLQGRRQGRPLVS